MPMEVDLTDHCGYLTPYTTIGATTLLAVRYENLFLVGRNGMHRYNNQRA
jgi:hypothetical protein